MNRLDGKVAIVTGAAMGIGAATAQLLAREGASVAVADINEPGAQAMAERIRSAGGSAEAFHVDISDAGSAEALAKAVDLRFGRIDILHNNAAATSLDLIFADLDAVATDLAVWDKTFAVNLRGTLLVSRFVIPVMIRGGGGSIINMSSVDGILPASGVRVAYSTSKAAIVMLTQHIAASFGKQGIRCNAIAPGTTLTETMKEFASPEHLEVAVGRALTTRLGEPADIAELVAFLGSEASGYITGTLIRADGGSLSYRQA